MSVWLWKMCGIRPLTAICSVVLPLQCALASRRTLLDKDFDCFDSKEFQRAFGDISVDLLTAISNSNIEVSDSSSSINNMNTNNCYERVNQSPLGAMTSLAQSLPSAQSSEFHSFTL